MRFVHVMRKAKPLASSPTPPTVSSAAGPFIRGFRTPESRSVGGDLVLIVAVALAVRLVWVVLLPPWQAFDETEHFAYTNHIAEQGTIPHAGVVSAYPDYSLEVQHSLDNTAFYPLVRWQTNNVGLLPLLDPTAFAPARQFSAAGSDRYDSGRSRATPYPPLYYLLEAIPDRVLHAAPIISRLFAMRAFSALFGAVGCLFAYLTAYDLFRTRRWGWSFGLSTAFVPAFAHNAASVNNDVLTFLLSLALIWFSVRALIRPHVSRWLILSTSVCAGLLFATKPTAFPVLVIAMAVVGGAFIVQSWRGLTRPQRRLALVLVAAGTLLLLCMLIVGYRFVPVVRAVVTENSLLGASAVSSPVRYSVPTYFRFLGGPLGRSYLWLAYSQFWGWFGWGAAVLPVAVLDATVPVCVGGIIGVFLRAWRRPVERRVWVLMAVFVLSQVIFLLFGVEYRLSFAASGTAIGLQGRYLFPVFTAILLPIIAGWAHLFHDSPRVLRGATIIAFILQLLGWSAVLTRYYDVLIGGVQ